MHSKKDYETAQWTKKLQVTLRDYFNSVKQIIIQTKPILVLYTANVECLHHRFFYYCQRYNRQFMMSFLVVRIKFEAQF